MAALLTRREYLQGSLALLGWLAPGSACGWSSTPAPRGEEIAFASLSRLAGLIRQGELSSRELVATYLDRIGRLDGEEGLNAYRTVARRRALRQAARLDELAARGRFLGPLHGVPLAVKDNLETQGIRTTGGSRILAGWVPPRDATAVRRLRVAGGIILGKTNMDELAMGGTGVNPHFGPTRNPYDPGRFTGGSSSGSAAAVAAGLCAAALGTDTGGSVRVPAALCGVVGLKPTRGRVGRGGVILLDPWRDTVGILTRCVEDAALLLEVLSGTDGRDPDSSAVPFPENGPLSPLPLRGLSLAFPDRHFLAEMDPQVESLFRECLARLEGEGARLQEIPLRLEMPPSDLLREGIASQLDAYLRSLRPEWSLERVYHQLGPGARSLLAQAGPQRKDRREQTAAYRIRLQGDLEGALRGHAALLLPTTPVPAGRLEEASEMVVAGARQRTFSLLVRYCQHVNLAGLPALSLPAGWTGEGLPVGLQLIGRAWRERELLRLALACQQLFPPWRPPL